MAVALRLGYLLSKTHSWNTLDKMLQVLPYLTFVERTMEKMERILALKIAFLQENYVTLASVLIVNDTVQAKIKRTESLITDYENWILIN